MSTSNTTSKIGAVFYIIWACLHLLAAYSVYGLGRSLDSSMVQGRVFQDAWNLLFFSIIAISVAATLNWRNSVWGYWINFVTVGIADIGFILFVLVPGYTPVWPSILGPVFWVLATIFSTIALLMRTKGATRSFTGDNSPVQLPSWIGVINVICRETLRKQRRLRKKDQVCLSPMAPIKLNKLIPANGRLMSSSM